MLTGHLTITGSKASGIAKVKRALVRIDELLNLLKETADEEALSSVGVDRMWSKYSTGSRPVARQALRLCKRPSGLDED